MTPPPNQTIADGVARLPANETGGDPILAKLKLHFDTGRFGPAIELAHAYFNYWPTVVSSFLGGFSVILISHPLFGSRASALARTEGSSHVSPAEMKRSR